MLSPILAECERCAGYLRAAANGAARIIYFYRASAMPLFLLDFYAKNEKCNLDAHDKKHLRMMVQTILRKD